MKNHKDFTHIAHYCYYLNNESQGRVNVLLGGHAPKYHPSKIYVKCKNGISGIKFVFHFEMALLVMCICAVVFLLKHPPGLVSEMTYNVSMGTLNPTIPYHTPRPHARLRTRAQSTSVSM